MVKSGNLQQAEKKARAGADEVLGLMAEFRKADEKNVAAMEKQRDQAADAHDSGRERTERLAGHALRTRRSSDRSAYARAAKTQSRHRERYHHLTEQIAEVRAGGAGPFKKAKRPERQKKVRESGK